MKIFWQLYCSGHLDPDYLYAILQSDKEIIFSKHLVFHHKSECLQIWIPVLLLIGLDLVIQRKWIDNILFSKVHRWSWMAIYVFPTILYLFVLSFFWCIINEKYYHICHRFVEHFFLQILIPVIFFLYSLPIQEDNQFVFCRMYLQQIVNKIRNIFHYLPKG